jgi:hypothetical protein
MRCGWKRGLRRRGTYESDAAITIWAGDASGPASLDAHIEQNHVQVRFITLTCADQCATVQAVGTGGYPPYTVAWDDGSTSATRQVCPTCGTNYQVTVTDTETTGELARQPETAKASLTADVIACPDGGTEDAGSGACISNPSFEGNHSLRATKHHPDAVRIRPVRVRSQERSGLLPGRGVPAGTRECEDSERLPLLGEVAAWVLGPEAFEDGERGIGVAIHQAPRNGHTAQLGK